MSNTILYFPSKRNDLDEDLVRLEITSESTLAKIETIRERVGKVIGADYMFLLLEHLFTGKAILYPEYDPIERSLPHQYLHHLDQMDIRELQLFFRTITVLMKKSYSLNNRSRRELFYLRSEVIRRITSENKV